MDDIIVVLGGIFAFVGVALFVIGKAQAENSIKLGAVDLKLSHPSLVIFALGVVMMLSARLFPSSEPTAQDDSEWSEDEEEGDPALEADDPTVITETRALEPDRGDDENLPAEAADEAGEEEFVDDEAVDDSADDPGLDDAVDDEEGAE